VAEDNLVNQQVTVGILQARGYRADVVGNGREALDALARNTYAAVLMDCQMPEMDGYAATTELRRREGGTRRTPVIALTAHALAGEREKCLAAGMDDYVSKPTLPADIHAALERCWARTGSPAPLAPAAPAPTAASEPAPATADPMRERLNVLEDLGGPELVRKVAELFLQSAPPQLEALARALEAGAADAAAFAAHSLKGAASNIGATAMAALCAEIEKQAGDQQAVAGGLALPPLEAEFARVRSALQARLEG
jgi:CheY-like chemotaxis protein